MLHAAHAKKQPKYEQARQLTPEQAALVQRAIAQEKVLIKNIQLRTPLVETYIQDTRPDVKLYEVPIDDQYMLSRVDFSKGFFDKTYEPKAEIHHGFFKGSMAAMTGLSRALGLEKFTYNPNGFMEMMFIDPNGFDQQHYVFSFVRREFLGSVRTWVYDVHPKADVKGIGRFYGRIWIEDEGGNVVRFNGTYTGPTTEDASKYFFHFDSWRMNVQPGIWLPVAVYVEETQRTEAEKSVGLKAQTHFWGYSLKLPTRESENVSVKVDEAVDKSDDSQDVGPLQASRMWITQAENNVIDRLVEAGLVAPLNSGGYENKVLDQIVINLVVPNNLAFTDQIHTRVLLTDTVEATTVGNTILLSKGLIDSLPSEEAIASVVAMELAHIAMGHHIDTRYAFNDRLLFPDTATFQKIDMNHTDVDNESASKTGNGVSRKLHVQGPAGECRPLLRAVGGSGQGTQGAEYADAGRLAAEAGWHAVDGGAGARRSQAELGRSGADPCIAAGKLAENRSLGRLSAHAECQALCADECPRQDAVRGDADLLQAATL